MEVKGRSPIIVIFLVFLIGVILLSSSSTSGTIHLAYAKKHGSSSSNCTGNETCPTPTPAPPPPPPSPSTPCPNGQQPDPSGKCPPSGSVDCTKNPKDCHICPDGKVVPLSQPCLPALPDHCKYTHNDTKIECPSSHGGGTKTIVKYVGGSQTGSMVVLPSTARDFANNDPRTLMLDFVNPTGPDAIGNYWVKGEVVNNGNTTLQGLKITVHWFDAGNKIIGVTYGYIDKPDTSLNPGDRSTFSVMADGHNDLIGIPKFVELSYDWQ